MKSILIGSLLTLILTQVCSAQPWILQSSGTINNLNDISFTDTLTGTIVGDQGTILRTTNGGMDWFEQSSGTSLSLFGVSFVNTDTGTVVGATGIILKTTNGGSDWTVQSSGVTAYLH
ncbi:MAG TPA: YCF48-related protein, partial [Ignavibacteriaceae bacterium]